MVFIGWGSRYGVLVSGSGLGCFRLRVSGSGFRVWGLPEGRTQREQSASLRREVHAYNFLAQVYHSLVQVYHFLVQIDYSLLHVHYFLLLLRFR